MSFLSSYILPSAILVVVFIFTQEATGAITRKSISHSRFLDSKIAPIKKTSDVKACFDLCQNTSACGSANYDLSEGICELNNNSHFTHPDQLKPKVDGYVYLPVRSKKPNVVTSKPKYKTCAKLKEMKPSSPSGVYELEVNGISKSVYCDMDNYGGGWSLVVSISSSSTNHLLQTEDNCFNTTLCVPLLTGTLPARKLSDSDIHALASHEGTFRIDVMTTSTMSYNGFIRIVSGAQFFNSTCNGLWCPRIIVSHVYPYVWESNCKGIEKGYAIVRHGCHEVFDTFDSSECGTQWKSSQTTAKRIQYNHCSTTGLYNTLQGYMFVR